MSDARSELENLRTALAASEQRAATAEADLARARAVVSTSEAMIAGLKLEIAILKRDKYGRSAERSAKLLDQMELQLGDLIEDAAEDRVQAEQKTTKVGAFERRKPVKKAFPAHLPRERVVVEAPSTCSCCGSDRIVKMGEDITETLEVIPRQWKVIQTVREKFPGLRPFTPQSVHRTLCRFADRRSPCRACEKITQPPAPFHPIPRGWAGPSLLAMIVFEKYGQHQPLNRQAERYAREGVDLSLSTLADQVGAVAELLKPLNALIEAHVFAAARLHGDDTTVPLLARGGTKTARLWTYVRDDRPFDGTAPPAVVFRFSRDRAGEHPTQHLAGWQGILQADAYAGYNQLYAAVRRPHRAESVRRHCSRGRPDRPRGTA
jgi:transposase